MELPARPDIQPAPKRKWTWWQIAGAVILGLILLGTIQDLTDAPSKDTTTSETPVGVTTTGISEMNRLSADMTWEAQDRATQRAFCLGVDTFGIERSAELVNQGADYTFTSTEARQIVTYWDETYC